MMSVVRLAGLLTQLYAACAASFAQPRVNPVLERARRIRLLVWVSVPVLVLFDSLVHPAAAFTMFDSLVDATKNESTTWFNTIRGMVTPTFTILATLEICWAAAIWAFEKDSLNSLAIEVIKKFMFIGFFYALLLHAGKWIPMVIETFTQVGDQTVDTANITTDSIVGDGLTIAAKLFAASLPVAVAMWAVPSEALGASIPGAEISYMTADFEMILCVIVCIAVLVAYVVVAAQFFTLKIESYILFAAGAIFLGLGASNWTKDYVSKYLNHAMHTGVRMLVLILTLSITLSAVKKVGTPPGLDVTGMLTLLGAALLQAIVAMRAPDMAGALMSGGGAGLTAGSGLGAARSAVGAGMGIAAKGISAAQGAGNLGKAVSAGHELMKSQDKTGAAAVLGGLRAVAGEVSKSLPGKLVNAIKAGGQGMGMGLGQGSMGQGMGQGGGGVLGGAGGQHQQGQKPGVFDIAKQNLRSRLPGAHGGEQGAPQAQAAAPGGSGPQTRGNTAHGGSGSGSTGPAPGSSANTGVASSPNIGADPSANIGAVPSPNTGAGPSANIGAAPSGNIGAVPSANIGAVPSANVSAVSSADGGSGTPVASGDGGVGGLGSPVASVSDDSPPSVNPADSGLQGPLPGSAAPPLSTPSLNRSRSAPRTPVTPTPVTPPNRLGNPALPGSRSAPGSGGTSQPGSSSERAASHTPGASSSNSIERT